MSCKAGQNLPLKMIQLVQHFYELAVTSVTNIPMKVIRERFDFQSNSDF